MSTNSNKGYYQPSLGVIAGWDNAQLPSEPNLPKMGWSITQIMEFLRNENGANFPTPEFLLQVEQLLESHLTDYNNPHKVTLNQIVGDIVGRLLTAIVPGTPPDIPPFYSFESSLGLPLGALFPATHHTTNLYRLNQAETVIDPTTEDQIINSDWTQGHPAIPLFSPVTNVTSPGWETNPSSRLNTQISSPKTYGDYPFSFYDLSEQNVYGSFGIKFPASQVANAVYSFTVFLMPLSPGQCSVILSPSDDAQNTVTVDLYTGEFTLGSSGVKAIVHRYRSGIVRVSMGWTSQATSNGVQIIQANQNSSGTQREGNNGTPLFAVAHPFQSVSTINQPTPILLDQPWSTTPFQPDLTRASAPPSLSSFMLTMTLNLYPAPAGATLSGTTILQWGSLTITRDQTNLHVNYNGTVLFTSAILEGFNVISLSYSTGQLMWKDLANPKQSVSGSFSPLPTTSLSIGPCSGYLSNMALYGQEDRDHVLEYLTNG